MYDVASRQTQLRRLTRGTKLTEREFFGAETSLQQIECLAEAGPEAVGPVPRPL